MIRKRLAMKFKTANGKAFTISLDGSKETKWIESIQTKKR